MNTERIKQERNRRRAGGEEKTSKEKGRAERE